MAQDEELQRMADQLESALEQETDAPRLSLDPETAKPSAVGDPNALPEKKGTYSLRFVYPPELVSEEDKLKMKKEDKTGYYMAEVKYENIFIKPIHRAKIAQKATYILADAEIIDLKGYTTKVQKEQYGQSFLNHQEDILDIIHMVLGVEMEQLNYLPPLEPGRFLIQLFQNEPNLIKEANNFLF